MLATGVLEYRRIRMALGAGLCVAVLVLAAVEPAGAIPRTPGFAKPLIASQDEFTPRGGLSTLTATVSGATSCSLAITPAVAGVPSSVACAGPGAISVRVAFPVNPAPTPVIYKATLQATEGTTTVSSSATIRVEGFRWLGHVSQHAVPDIVTAEACANPNDFPPQSHFVRACVEVSRDGEAAYLTKAGAHWSDVDGAVPLVAASCVPGSDDFCVVLDANGNYLTFNGTSWTAPAPLALSAGIPLRPVTIDCEGLPAAEAFANQCIAADTSGHVIVATFGSTTTVVTSSVALTGPTKVACTTPELCMVVDAGGTMVVRNGSTWSHPIRIDPMARVDGAACTADHHTCVVIGTSGSIVSFELRGAVPVKIQKQFAGSLVGGRTFADGVACAMAYCLLVLQNGSLLQGVGGSWHLAGISFHLHAGDSPVGIAVATSATTVWCSVFTHGWLANGGVVNASDTGSVIPVI